MKKAFTMSLVVALLIVTASPAPASQKHRARGGVVVEAYWPDGTLFNTHLYSFTAQGDPTEAKGELNWRIRGPDGFKAQIRADVDCYHQVGERGYISGVFTSLRPEDGAPDWIGGAMVGVVVDSGEPGTGPLGDQAIFQPLLEWGLEQPYCTETFALDGLLDEFYGPSSEPLTLAVVAGNLQVG